MNFQNARFLLSAPTAKELPKGAQPEIALIGRSNVGKSSLLNHLFRKRNLARTSSTPGKTRDLNLYSVDDKLTFVDLPGYGYAKCSQSEQQRWGPMVENYLSVRTQLKIALLLIDSRHTVSPLDAAALEWILSSKLSLIVVLTKCDKLKKSERKAILEKLRQALDHPCVPFSIQEGRCRAELIDRLYAMLGASP